MINNIVYLKSLSNKNMINMAKRKKKKPEESVETVEAVEDKPEESVEPVEEQPEAEEPKELPKFMNKTKEGIKIRLGNERGNDAKWITVNPGESVTIPRKIALANKLKIV